MRAKLTLNFLLTAVFVTSLFSANSFAQSPAREKPKLKDFGSSLKKLKWDPEKNETHVSAGSENSASNGDDIVRIETSLVACDLLVVNKQGQTVQGLSTNDFTIKEDGMPQQVGHFLLGDNRSLPRSIVLIIDYSGSQFPYIRNSVVAAKLLVDKLGPLDRMAIVTDDVEMLVDFTNDKANLKKKLQSLVDRTKGQKGFLGFGSRKRFGRSAQYSALMATLKEAFDEEDQRPIIVFQTDGDEAFYLRNPIVVPAVPPNLRFELRADAQQEVEQRLRLQREGMTEFSLDDVYRAIEKSHATIYTVVPGFRLIGLTPEQQIERLKADDERQIGEWLTSVGPKVREAFKAREEERQRKVTIDILKYRAEQNLKIQSALAEVSALSGGWIDYLETPSQAQEIYSRIFSDINQRYIVGYYPSNKEHDGKRRKISFEVKGHPDYQILGRRAYFAPGP